MCNFIVPYFNKLNLTVFCGVSCKDINSLYNYVGLTQMERYSEYSRAVQRKQASISILGCVYVH